LILILGIFGQLGQSTYSRAYQVYEASKLTTY